MERRLLQAITTPAMVVTLLSGVALGERAGQWARGLAARKLLLVLLMLACHGVLARHVAAFAADERPQVERLVSRVQRGADRAVHRHRDLGGS